MAPQPASRRRLLDIALVRFGGAFLLLGLMLFLPAGTLAYWQAWLYLAVLLVPMAGVLLWLLRDDPELLERRLRTRERGDTHRTELWLSILWMLLAFVGSGFDYRFGWSNVAVWLVLLADGLVLTGYAIFFLVLRENSYASRVVEVAEGQRVIDTGPYAVVRHPMYSGVLLVFLFTPLALGSYWTMVAGILMVYVLIRRILREEALLSRELDGYRSYLTRVRYRLIPGFW